MKKKNIPLDPETEKKLIVVAICLPAVGALGAVVLLLQGAAVWVRLIVLGVQAVIAIPAALFVLKK